MPPVKNPKEKKLLESAQADEIEELIHKSKIRIAESKEKEEDSNLVLKMVIYYSKVNIKMEKEMEKE